MTIGVVAISFFFAFGWQLFLVFVTYCRNILRSLHQGLKKFFGLFSKVFTWRRKTVLVERVVVRRSRSPRRRTWFGAGRERSASRSWRTSRSDSDEVIVIEGRSSARRRARSSREYRRDRSRSSSLARRSMSKTTLLGIIPALFALIGLRQGIRTEVVEEQYTRRRSTSPVWRWYGDDEPRYSQKRKKWPPWAWFEKSPTPYQRRREITYREQRRRTAPKGFYGAFITPLLGLFGISQQPPTRRTSFTSSYFSDYYGSGSSRARSSNETSEARSRRSRRS